MKHNPLRFLPAMLVLFPLLLQAQWTNDGVNTYAPTNDFNNTAVRRGSTGIGFFDQAAYNAAAGTSGARFLVQGGVLGHYVNGQVGAFTGKWTALGIGNPGGAPNPYGLAIADNNNVGFYNLLGEFFNNANRTNTIAGFGISGGNNTNRFIVRGYSGPFASVGRDLIIANPNGSVSINTEPSQVGPDLSTTFYVDGAASNARFKNIFINNNTIAVTKKFISFSAIGKEGNITNPGLDTTPIEGFRAQFTQQGPVTSTTFGTAVNLQVVRNPNAPNPPLIDAIANSVGGEFAELSWQDLGYAGPASTNPAQLPVAVAQSLDKFFISFRNGLNTGPFVAGNRLPVATFQSNGRVGIGQVAPVSPISFFGPNAVLLDVNGGIFSNIGFFLSDKRMKKDIRKVDNAMEMIRKMEGTTYYFRTDEFPDKNLPGGRHYGFIAQDLEKIMPEAAAQNDNGDYAINYNALIPVLTEAMKEQDQTIQELKTELAELRSAINDLKAGQETGKLQGYRLDQNSPNPTNGNTVIGYALPEGTTGARIAVYDLSGRQVRSWNLSETQGQISLNAGELPNGLYIYDLQVNGRQILERKMTVAGL